MKKSPLHFILGILQAFIALGALGGGFVMMKDPSGASMGISASVLSGTFFSDFFFPGLILFTFNGLGCMAASVFSLIRHRLAGWLGIFFGGGLFLWIVVQVLLIGYWSGVPIQPFYGALGLIEAGLGLWIVLSLKKTARVSLIPVVRAKAGRTY